MRTDARAIAAGERINVIRHSFCIFDYIIDRLTIRLPERELVNEIEITTDRTSSKVEKSDKKHNLNIICVSCIRQRNKGNLSLRQFSAH